MLCWPLLLGVIIISLQQLRWLRERSVWQHRLSHQDETQSLSCKNCAQCPSPTRCHCATSGIRPYSTGTVNDSPTNYQKAVGSRRWLKQRIIPHAKFSEAVICLQTHKDKFLFVYQGFSFQSRISSPSSQSLCFVWFGFSSSISNTRSLLSLYGTSIIRLNTYGYMYPSIPLSIFFQWSLLDIIHTRMLHMIDLLTSPPPPFFFCFSLSGSDSSTNRYDPTHLVIAIMSE